MINKWRMKIFSKLARAAEFETAADVGDEVKKCPFLKPHTARVGIGTKAVERECMRELCELWDVDEELCAKAATPRLLRKLIKLLEERK